MSGHAAGHAAGGAGAVAVMSLAMLLAPGMDVLAKLATDTVSPAVAALGRFAAQTAILVPLVLIAGQTGRPGWLHLAGGMCLATALFCITAAVAVMPVANAIAIFFVEPLILTLISVPLLGERIGWRRVAAVLTGLGGAVVVLRPNLAAYGPEAALPLGAAVAFALYLVVTRVLSLRGQRLAMQLWTGAVAAGVLAVLVLVANALMGPAAPGVLAATPPDGRVLGLMLAMGVLACLTHQMLAFAFSRAEAGALAPLQYLEIISATLLGWLVFGDFPDAMTWLGTAIIIGAGLYVLERERQQARVTALTAQARPDM
ncbi:MAG: DMT family transporter [Pseudomonadota bacterium]